MKMRLRMRCNCGFEGKGVGKYASCDSIPICKAYQLNNTS